MGALYQFDLFSQPFKFHFTGRNSGRNTSMGTLCSIFVILTGLVYLVYLLAVWFSGELNPKIIVQSNTITSLEYILKTSPIMLKYYTAGQEIQFNQYFAYQAQFTEGKENEDSSEDIDTGKCEDITDQFGDQATKKGYICINPQKESGDDSMKLFVNSSGQSNYVLLQQKACINDPSGESGKQGGKTNCSGVTDIEKLMREKFFKIEILLPYNEFDIKASKLTKRYQKIVLQGDYNTVSYYTFYVEVSKLTEDKGWLWSSKTDHLYISGYTVDLQVLDKDYFVQKIGGYTIDRYFSYFKFELQLKQTETIVEHIRISEIFAQFGAIFNILLYIGIIARLNSEAQIYEEMTETMLKNYYKSTAEQIVKQDIEKELQKLKTEQHKGIKKSPTTEELIKKAKKQRSREINTLLRVFIPRNAKKQTIQDDTAVNKEQVYGIILDKVIDNMNCSNLFQEVYKLKTGMQILFTPKQYAALNYVGRRIPEQYSQRKEINQLEQNDFIEEDIIQREKHLEQFLKDMQEGRQENEFSKTIYECLLQSVQQGEYHNAFLQNQSRQLEGKKTISKDEQDYLKSKIGQKSSSNRPSLQNNDRAYQQSLIIQDIDVIEENEEQENQEKTNKNADIKITNEQNFGNN